MYSVSYNSTFPLSDPILYAIVICVTCANYILLFFALNSKFKKNTKMMEKHIFTLTYMFSISGILYWFVQT